MTSTRPLFIGIDIGTSSVKALMAGPEGVVDTVSAPHTTARPAPGAAEQDPAAWLSLAEAALDRFARHPRAGEVAAIGVTSQVNTRVSCQVSAGCRGVRPASQNTWVLTCEVTPASRPCSPR